MTTIAVAYATEKQLAFIVSLRVERALPEIEAEELSGLTRKAASAEIERLLKMPKVGRAAKAEEVTVAPGYYAVEVGGVLRFYAVKAGKGRWEGRTFVNRFASDYFARIDRLEIAAARVAIAEDPKRAAERFASEIGRCYACGRQLTDAESRRLGIGPDCRKMGRGF